MGQIVLFWYLYCLEMTRVADGLMLTLSGELMFWARGADLSASAGQNGWLDEPCTTQ